MFVTTVPGFSSRSTVHHTRQFEQRDERMDEHEQAGWSNSAAVEDAPQDVAPEIQEAEELVPGFSNGKAVKGDEPAADESGSEAKVVDDGDVEDKAVKPAKKTAAKKKG